MGLFAKEVGAGGKRRHGLFSFEAVTYIYIYVCMYTYIYIYIYICKNLGLHVLARFIVDTLAGFVHANAPAWTTAWHPKDTDAADHLYEAQREYRLAASLVTVVSHGFGFKFLVMCEAWR